MENWSVGDWAYVIDFFSYSHYGYYGKVIRVEDDNLKVDLEGKDKTWFKPYQLYKLSQEDVDKFEKISSGEGEYTTEEKSILEEIFDRLYGEGNYKLTYYNDDKLDNNLDSENTDISSSKIFDYTPVSEQAREDKYMDLNHIRKKWKRTKEQYYDYIYLLRQSIEMCLEFEDYDTCRNIGGEYKYYINKLTKKELDEYNTYCIKKKEVEENGVPIPRLEV